MPKGDRPFTRKEVARAKRSHKLIAESPMSPRGMSKHLDVTQSAIAQYVTGVNPLGFETACRFALVLRAPLEAR